jgi:hypothetical protein
MSANSSAVSRPSTRLRPNATCASGICGRRVRSNTSGWPTNSNPAHRRRGAARPPALFAADASVCGSPGAVQEILVKSRPLEAKRDSLVSAVLSAGRASRTTHTRLTTASCGFPSAAKRVGPSKVNAVPRHGHWANPVPYRGVEYVGPVASLSAARSSAAAPGASSSSSCIRRWPIGSPQDGESPQDGPGHPDARRASRCGPILDW